MDQYHIMIKFAFLFLALGLIVLPFVLQFDKKFFKEGTLPAAIGASLVSGVIFSAITLAMQLAGLLHFDTASTIGLIIGGVPLEQYLLNFSFAFAASGLYQYLNMKFPKNDLQKYSLAVSNLLLGLCVAFLFFGYTKWYTMFTFATLTVVLFLIEYVGSLRFMYKAYRAFLVMLVPFYLVYGILFWNGVLRVAKNQLTGMFVAKIPIETHFIALSMVLVSVYVFEFLMRKRSV